MTIEEIKEDTKLGKSKIDSFLKELRALSLVVQTGEGVKGSPLRYFRPNDSFLPIKGGVPKE